MEYYSISVISLIKLSGVGLLPADGIYSAKSAYNMLHAGSTPLLGHILIWKTWTLLRIKIFLWLAFKRRHWTGDWRARHGLEARELYYLCHQGQDTIDHIIAACPFFREVWFYVLQALSHRLSHIAATTIGWWRRLRSLFNDDQWAGMNSLFVLVSWQL